MVEAVKQSIEYIESSDAIRKRVRKIVLPNVAMFVGILAMLIICTLVAIPQIQNVFDSIGSKDKLPEVTLAFANFLNLTIKYWYIPTISIIAIVSVVIAYFSTPKGKYQWDMFKYKMPIFRKTYIFIRLYKINPFIIIKYNKWCKGSRSSRNI